MRPLFPVVLAAASWACSAADVGPPETPEAAQLEPANAGFAAPVLAPAQASELAVLPPYAHPPPPPEPLDRRGKGDGAFAERLGSNGTHVWIDPSSWTTDDTGFTVVVDRTTGCAVESYRKSAFLRTVNQGYNDMALNGLDEVTFDRNTLLRLNTAATAADLRRVIGLAARFQRTEYEEVAWSQRGAVILVAARRLYHSRDGSTFQPVDDLEAYAPTITPDGRTAVYERCLDPLPRVPARECIRRELVAWPLDGSRKPLQLVRTWDAQSAGLSKDGHAVVWRPGTAKSCMQLVDVHDAHVARQTCFRAAPLTPTAAVGDTKWLRTSPNERYDAIRSDRDDVSSHVQIVDRVEARIVRTLPLHAEVLHLGDHGEVIARKYGPAGESIARVSYMALGRADVALGTEDSYDVEAGRALSFRLPEGTTLGKAACRVTHAFPLPAL